MPFPDLGNAATGRTEGTGAAKTAKAPPSLITGSAARDRLAAGSRLKSPRASGPPRLEGGSLEERRRTLRRGVPLPRA